MHGSQLSLCHKEPTRSKQNTPSRGLWMPSIDIPRPRRKTRYLHLVTQLVVGVLRRMNRMILREHSASVLGVFTAKYRSRNIYIDNGQGRLGLTCLVALRSETRIMRRNIQRLFVIRNIEKTWKINIEVKIFKYGFFFKYIFCLSGILPSGDSYTQSRQFNHHLSLSHQQLVTSPLNTWDKSDYRGSEMLNEKMRILKRS